MMSFDSILHNTIASRCNAKCRTKSTPKGKDKAKEKDKKAKPVHTGYKDIPVKSRVHKNLLAPRNIAGSRKYCWST